MIYLVALVEPFALVIVVSIGARLLTNERREHSRERDLMLNKLLNLAGKPWQTPPSEQVMPDDSQPLVYLVSPDQQPVN